MKNYLFLILNKIKTMRTKVKILCVLLVAGFAFSSCDQPVSQQDAIDFINAITEEHATLQTEIHVLDELLDNFEEETCYEQLNEVIETAELVLSNITKIKLIEGGENYFNAFKAFAEVQIELANNEYSKIIAILSLPEELYAEKREEHIELAESLLDKFYEVYDNFVDARIEILEHFDLLADEE
ncbi:MAG: hypothetical protein GX879_04230 [Bacteroidales bacterium]|nr:hypothetical protein [Bacteroidales bacterium]